MTFKDFWYIAAQSRDIGSGNIIDANILTEWIALFRDENGHAVAIEDRCLHRCVKLSKGQVHKGRLKCAYHGWTYDRNGHVIDIPSEVPGTNRKAQARTFAVCEIDDYIYIRLSDDSTRQESPFRIPYYKEKGWASIRLVNRFHNNVTNCAENFVDIPHTAFVHPKIFRSSKGERIKASVRRAGGSVMVSYHGEQTNLGIFSRFLNPGGVDINHTDAFHMPNVTCVDYQFSQHRRFIITSQCVPVTNEDTIVYTDLTYNYGLWNRIARPVIRWQAQKIIDQDIKILGLQMEAIKKYGPRFTNTEADIIHVLIESIRRAIEEGHDPRKLPEQSHEIEFRV